jgi:hypothetical protein
LDLSDRSKHHSEDSFHHQFSRQNENGEIIVARFGWNRICRVHPNNGGGLEGENEAVSCW